MLIPWRVTLRIPTPPGPKPTILTISSGFLLACDLHAKILKKELKLEEKSLNILEKSGLVKYDSIWPEKGTILKRQIISNQYFSGDMLVFFFLAEVALNKKSMGVHVVRADARWYHILNGFNQF